MKMHTLKRIGHDLFVFGFMAYGFLWTAVDSFGNFFRNSKPEGFGWYSALIFISVVCALWKSRIRKRIELQVPLSDSSIELLYGDIFEGTGVIVIPVNEYFDGLLGDHVSENSLTW